MIFKMKFSVLIVFGIYPVIASLDESSLQHTKLNCLSRVKRQQRVYLSKGDTCTLKGYKGTCKNVGDCPSSDWTEMIREFPFNVKICGYENEVPIVCCINNDQLEGTPSKPKALELTAYQKLSEENQCIIPPRLKHGAYVVSNVPNAAPGDYLDSFELKVACRRGYGFLDSEGGRNGNGPLNIYCVRGTWSQNMPKCVRYCKLNPDPSIRYMCNTPGGGYRVCDLYVPPGTTVNPICNSPIYYSAESLTYMTCIGGFWDYVAKCKAECGRVTPAGDQLLIGGDIAKRGELPWHAGVFTKTTIPYMQICGGSLVSNDVVISAAHCFWKDVQNQLPASQFAIAVGKLYRPWNSERDIDAQKSDIKEIKLPPLFYGSSANFQEDIALLIMTSPFVYKTFVRPVCINFDTIFDRRQLQHGKLGKVAGWGLQAANGKPSQVLQVLKIPYIDWKTCIDAIPPSFREYITGDKFCAGYTNGTALCKGDSGGGLSFSAYTELDIERYYLRGVVSTAPSSEDLCNSMTYTAFTKITKHENFIKEAVASAVKTCPPHLFQCDDGACLGLTAECDGRQDCADGSDEAENLCTADLDSPSTPSLCVLPNLIKNGSYVIINPSGTSGDMVRAQIISVSCNKGYTAVNSEGQVIKSNSLLMTCVNGKWDKSVPSCVSAVNLECGQVYPASTPLVLGNRIVERNELPWHASIFSKKKTPYSHICGGNIISKDHILTAAHCFRMGTDPENYAISAGQILAMWDNDENIEIQKFNVLKINIPSTYKGDENTDFNADLAVVVLDSSISFTDFIKPICLNFESGFNKNDLEPGQLMRVAAWSLINIETKKTARLHRLTAVDMTYLGLDTCNSTIVENLKKQVSVDKICAGYTKNRSAFRTLAGSGVVTPRTLAGTERYYLQGVTAYVVPCQYCRNSTDVYYMFTSIADNGDFIKQFLNFLLLFS